MNKIFLAAALFVTFFGLSQTQSDEATTVYTNPEVKAEFPGGLSEFYSFIAKNFQTPVVEKDTEFKFYVSFIVEPDGDLSEVTVIRDPGYGIGEEAVRVVKLSPVWIPAKQDGKAVRYKNTLPLIITAQAEAQEDPAQKFLDDVKLQQDMADVQPEFPGGVGEFNQTVYKWLRIPEVNIDINAKIYVYFVVDADGSVKDVRCIHDPGHGLGTEAVKAVQSVGTKWKPAFRDGKAIAYPYILPLRVTIQADPNKAPELEYIEMEQADAEYTRPMYPGGPEKLHEDFFRKFNYPEVSAAVDAVVHVRFTVNPDGSMSNIECTRDPGFGLGMESVKALQMLKRKWVPATKNGNAIAYNVSFPVRIMIDAGSGPKQSRSQKINREVGPPVNRNGIAPRIERRPYRQR